MIRAAAPVTATIPDDKAAPDDKVREMVVAVAAQEQPPASSDAKVEMSKQETWKDSSLETSVTLSPVTSSR